MSWGLSHTARGPGLGEACTAHGRQRGWPGRNLRDQRRGGQAHKQARGAPPLVFHPSVSPGFPFTRRPIGAPGGRRALRVALAMPTITWGGFFVGLFFWPKFKSEQIMFPWNLLLWASPRTITSSHVN